MRGDADVAGSGGADLAVGAIDVNAVIIVTVARAAARGIGDGEVAVCGSDNAAAIGINSGTALTVARAASGSAEGERAGSCVEKLRTGAIYILKLLAPLLLPPVPVTDMLLPFPLNVLPVGTYTP